MSYSEERFYQGQPGTVEGTLWTVPATMNNLDVKRIQIKEILICNTSGAPVPLNLSIVPSGGTGGNANRIISNGKSIDAGSTVRYGLSQVMYVGDFLSGFQGTASALTLTISGVVKS